MAQLILRTMLYHCRFPRPVERELDQRIARGELTGWTCEDCGEAIDWPADRRLRTAPQVLNGKLVHVGCAKREQWRETVGRLTSLRVGDTVRVSDEVTTWAQPYDGFAGKTGTVTATGVRMGQGLPGYDVNVEGMVVALPARCVAVLAERSAS